FGDETTYDTVVSVSATVGPYNNCIVVRETSVTDSVNIIDESYYAPTVGLVKKQRFYHRGDPQAYIASLTDILAYDCYVGLQNNEFADENLITIYPNPASDIINLEINNTTKEVLNLNIYNIMGSLVKTETTAVNNNQINISDLNNGIYLIEIKSKDLITKQKLIIQK
ncbi:MAG: T9SS type A sorting domain-containing protein, partial [Bacteroidales bacterium]